MTVSNRTATNCLSNRTVSNRNFPFKAAFNSIRTTQNLCTVWKEREISKLNQSMTGGSPDELDAQPRVRTQKQCAAESNQSIFEILALDVRPLWFCSPLVSAIWSNISAKAWWHQADAYRLMALRVATGSLKKSAVRPSVWLHSRALQSTNIGCPSDARYQSSRSIERHYEMAT